MGLISHHLGVGDFEGDTLDNKLMPVSVYQVYWSLFDDSDDIPLGVYTTEEKAQAFINKQKYKWRYYIFKVTADNVDKTVEDVRGF